MESPEVASEMACPMVLQAVWADVQLLLSFPFTPSTNHVVLARVLGARARNTEITTRLVCMRFIMFLRIAILVISLTVNVTRSADSEWTEAHSELKQLANVFGQDNLRAWVPCHLRC